MKKPSSRFSTGNIVEVMDYEMGEEEIVVAHGKMTNVEENTFHGVIIYRYCMCFWGAKKPQWLVSPLEKQRIGWPSHQENWTSCREFYNVAHQNFTQYMRRVIDECKKKHFGHMMGSSVYHVQSIA